MNSISVISPYKYWGIWVFDDERVGLLREAFVSGADLMMDKISENIPNAQDGFNLLFSTTPFPDYSMLIEWVETGSEEFGGNVYLCREHGIFGWLCPALYLYFSAAPKTIYLKSLPKV